MALYFRLRITIVFESDGWPFPELGADLET
jgi:hypothetical protein